MKFFERFKVKKTENEMGDREEEIQINQLCTDDPFTNQLKNLETGDLIYSWSIILKELKTRDLLVGKHRKLSNLAEDMQNMQKAIVDNYEYVKNSFFETALNDSIKKVHQEAIRLIDAIRNLKR